MNPPNRLFAFVISLTFLAPNLAAAQTASQEATTKASATDTTPPLILAAAVISTGQALVWDLKNESYALVRLGSELHGFKISRILRDSIILHRNGTRHRLALTPALFASPKKPRPEAAGAPAGITIISTTPPTVTAPQAETKVETKAKTKVETKAKTKVEAKAKATAEANLDAKPAIRVTAIRKESQPEPKLPSFRLREVRAEVSQYVRGDSSYRVRLSRAGHIRLAGVNGKSLLHRIGLRDGDEIKTVAGVRINSRSTAVDAYLALRPGTTMEIVLIRKGKQQSVRLQII